ncbi:MAG: transposase [Candidatus Desulfatibia sp.]|uniref:transposase n=1 Tax=Candidatus Desulfatibia sp. TaxID=3101189 RepID=UPI002F31F4BE
MQPLELIQQGKLKRYFRATRKLNSSGLVSHITQRVAGKEPLFLEESDYLFMLGLLKEISSNYSLRIFAFCLMQNHIHLLLSPKEENLYDAMRDLFSRYAMGFNRKYERKGHLFGGPYRQAVCCDDGYLLAASLYIHLNPVKAGIEEDPTNYRWSSVRLYADDDAPKSFVDPDFVLSLLSTVKPKKQKEYRRLLMQGSGIEAGHVLEQEDAVEQFCSTLASIFPRLFKRIDKKKHVAESSGIDLLSMVELDRRIEDMKNSCFSSRAPESKRAKKFLIEQLISRGFKRSEIAEKLDMSRKTVYNIIKSST